MAIYAEKSGQIREPIEAGLHLARCYKMIFVGTVQESMVINGKPTVKTLKKVRVGWEFPEMKKVFKEEKGEQPLVLEQEFTLSMGDKANLRKMLESWRGAPYTDEQAEKVDITKLLGQPCMINLTHKKSQNGSVYEQIASVVPVPKQMKCPPQINPNYELNYDEAWSQEKFDALPDFIKDKMKTSVEYKAFINKESNTFIDERGQPIQDDPNVEIIDDLPF
jgi:hypothetical protein